MHSTYDKMIDIINESNNSTDDLSFMIDELYLDGELQLTECIKLHSELE